MNWLRTLLAAPSAPSAGGTGRVAVAARVEALEGRAMPSASPATAAAVGLTTSQRAHAAALGALVVNRTTSGTVPSAGAVGVYSFQAKSGEHVLFDATASRASALQPALSVYNTGGKPIGSAALVVGSGTALPDARLSYTFAVAGTYYLGVSGAAPGRPGGTGGYTLSCAVGGNGAGTGSTGSTGSGSGTGSGTGTGSGFAGIRFEVTRSDGLSTPVTITRFDGASHPISPAARTWILIHGWEGNGHTAGLTRLDGDVAASYPADQVLTLDWSAAASDPNYADTEQWLPAIGAAAAQALTANGFSPASINLVGYSFGSYIADQIGAHLQGGADTILAIDPPHHVPAGAGTAGAFDPDVSVNFAAHSHFSWAFHDADPASSVNIGDAVTPATASEAIDVTGTNHGDMIGLVASLIAPQPTSTGQAAAGGSAGTGSLQVTLTGNQVGQAFQLSRLLACRTCPWTAQTYDSAGQPYPGGYDALLTSSNGGTQPGTLTYLIPAPASAPVGSMP